MRTVTTSTTTTPSVCLAIESSKISFELAHQLSELGCQCAKITNFSELSEKLNQELPHLLLVSLDLVGECGLDFCRERDDLLNRVPVAFFADNPAQNFDKSLAAIRAGAVDVLTLPLDETKLLKLAKLASQQLSQKETFSSEPSIPALDSSTIDSRIDATNGSASENLGRYQPVMPHSDRTNGITWPNYTATAKNSSAGFEPVNAKYNVEVNVQPTSLEPRSLPINYSSSNDECPNATARRAGYESRIRELETWILGSSPAMQAVRSTIAEVAETDANVMIHGASGTGKELVATALHRLSKRSEGAFEPVNMTEIPHELAESLLFGHEKGAFTGADFRQIGVCEAADGGTLFLDEIGEMALATQPKLLRFLQEGTVKRIGSRNFKKVDVRVITATNRNPKTIVQEGCMREDLFFRLHVVPIHIPPLQQRPEDIEQLAMLFLNRYVKAYNRTVEGFTPQALDIFRRHDWPGNVRQLENVVERLVVFAKGRLIDVGDIPSEIHAASMFGESMFGEPVPAINQQAPSNGVIVNTVPYMVNGQDAEVATAIAQMSAIQRTERAAIVEALQRSGGHVIDAANLLGLGQATVYRKIKQYHIPHQRRRRRRSPK